MWAGLNDEAAVWCEQHQDVEETKDSGAEEVKDRDREERWTAVLSLDHIRSRSRYVGLLQGWSQQLRLTGRLLMGRTILIILQGARADIKVLTHVQFMACLVLAQWYSRKQFTDWRHYYVHNITIIKYRLRIQAVIVFPTVHCKSSRK